jgi:hypothetical protein
VTGLAVPEVDDDGIDPDVWDHLTTVVTAAARGDAGAYFSEIEGWPRTFPLPGQRRMGVYLMYALSFQVRVLLQRNQPTADDLRQTALGAHPRVLLVLERAPAADLEETLRLAFELPPRGTGVTPGQFGALAGAILGVLMSDAASDLAAIRPRLASWWRRNQESFRAQGLLD